MAGRRLVESGQAHARLVRLCAGQRLLPVPAGVIQLADPKGRVELEILKKASLHAHLLKVGAVAASVVVAAIFAAGQTPSPAKPAAAQSKAAPATGTPTAAGAPFFIHGKHVKELVFDCETCHVPVSAGSVVLKRPGHDQCMSCHQEAYDNIDQKYCSLCHS